VKEVFRYSPTTGLFYNRFYRSSNAPKDAVAGAVKEGRYVQINLDGHLWYAHRLAWLYMTGVMPPELVDHKNGNGLDNRWRNLRLSSDQLNPQNRHTPDCDNTSGYLGVYPNKNGTFTAQLVLRRKKVFSQVFDTAEEAHQAYLKAKRKFHSHSLLHKRLT
jgi:hypothetical protein